MWEEGGDLNASIIFTKIHTDVIRDKKPDNKMK